MIGLLILGWVALWAIPYVFLIKSVLRDMQPLRGHVVPGVIFGGLLAPGFGVGHGVGLMPAGFSTIGWLGDIQEMNVGDFLVNVASWVIVASIFTAITYSLRRKEPHFQAEVDNRSRNPFD